MTIEVGNGRIDAAREELLVERAARDPSSMGALFDMYLEPIYGFVARRTESRAIAEEVTASVFQRVLGALHRGDFREPRIGEFLYRVAASAVLDDARRRDLGLPRWVRAADFSASSWTDLEETAGDGLAMKDLAAAVDRQRLRRALKDLPEDAREVILLRYYDGLGGDDLGAAMGETAGSATLALHRALRAIAGSLVSGASDAA